LEAIRLGVQGMVLKEMAPQLLVRCVRKVHSGEPWFERNATGRLLESLIRREAGEHQIAQVLTQREIEIVRLATRGLRNKEIPAKLPSPEGTVKVPLHNIYTRLEVDGRMALSVFARGKGLI